MATSLQQGGRTALVQGHRHVLVLGCIHGGVQEQEHGRLVQVVDLRTRSSGCALSGDMLTGCRLETHLVVNACMPGRGLVACAVPAHHIQLCKGLLVCSMGRVRLRPRIAHT